VTINGICEMVVEAKVGTLASVNESPEGGDRDSYGITIEIAVAVGLKEGISVGGAVGVHPYSARTVGTIATPWVDKSIPTSTIPYRVLRI